MVSTKLSEGVIQQQYQPALDFGMGGIIGRVLHGDLAADPAVVRLDRKILRSYPFLPSISGAFQGPPNQSLRP